MKLRCAQLLGSIFLIYSAGVWAQDVTAIVGGTLIDGSGSPPQENTVIVIRDMRIDSIRTDGKVPDGAKVIDAKGKYIVPGLWDKHLHYKDWFPEMLITNGVTSAYVQGGGPWLHAQNEGVAKGKILGPRMFFRERKFDVFDSVEEARDTTRSELERLKPSFVKVYTGITAEHLKVVAEEAHRAGLHIEGHIGIGAREAIEAGIDGLTHASGIAYSTVPLEVLETIPDMRVIDSGYRRVRWPAVSTWDESKTGGPNPDLSEYWLYLEDPRRLMLFGLMDRDMANDLIDLMIKEEVFIESCLTYAFRNVHDRAAQYRQEDLLLLSEPDLHYIPELVKKNVLDYSLLDKVNDEELALMTKGYENFQWFFKTFVDRGGRLIIGPDTTSINHSTMLPGVATRREMELLVDSGISPMHAIQAGSLWAAENVNQGKDLGSVEKGKVADLLMLPRNPLEDISAYKDIQLVMQNGRVLNHGFHYYYNNPIPWPAGNEISYRDEGFGPVTEIPASITGISPQAIVESGGDITLSVKGGPFISTSTIEFDGQWLETEVVSPDEVRAFVPARLIQNVGTYPIHVAHRKPGWGKTNTLYLIVKFK